MFHNFKILKPTNLLKFTSFISTLLIHWEFNFTWSTTMHTNFFLILLTNIHKCLEKILFTRQTESYFLSDFFPDLLWCVKSIFSRHFWVLVNKIQKKIVCIVVLRVKLHLQWIKTVEMRAKSVWWVKIRCFPPQFSPRTDERTNGGTDQQMDRWSDIVTIWAANRS